MEGKSIFIGACFMALLALPLHAMRNAEFPEKLIGWKGESYHPKTTFKKLRGGPRPRIETLSWSPRAFIYHDFLSEEECRHLMEISKPHMEKSKVIDNESGMSKDSKARSSEGAFLPRGTDDIVTAIEERIADWTHVPVEHGEAVHVIHYAEGQEYTAHYDYFFNEKNMKMGGNRMATVLMYLADTEEGGETVFPDADGFDPALLEGDFSKCAKGKLAVKPKMGDAILFWDMSPDGVVDPKSLHTACPVIKGNKWSATKWMHVGPYGVPTEIPGCKDLDSMCAEWAISGECKKNPSFMIGGQGTEGHCRFSCKACASKAVQVK